MTSRALGIASASRAVLSRLMISSYSPAEIVVGTVTLARLCVVKFDSLCHSRRPLSSGPFLGVRRQPQTLGFAPLSKQHRLLIELFAPSK
jgi:hypothetical protein